MKVVFFYQRISSLKYHLNSQQAFVEAEPHTTVKGIVRRLINMVEVNNFTWSTSQRQDEKSCFIFNTFPYTQI